MSMGIYGTNVCPNIGWRRKEKEAKGIIVGISPLIKNEP